MTDLMTPTEKMLGEYGRGEYNTRIIGFRKQKKRKLQKDGSSSPASAEQKKDVSTLLFKDVDGMEKIGDLPLPMKIKLPLGSSEAVFLACSRNSGAGIICIEEYINSKHTVVDKGHTNPFLPPTVVV